MVQQRSGAMDHIGSRASVIDTELVLSLDQQLRFDLVKLLIANDAIQPGETIEKKVNLLEGLIRGDTHRQPSSTDGTG
jgi:hypothetical protein